MYFSWPDPNSPPCWQYLGYISNEKPSSIYRITKLKKPSEVVINSKGFGFNQAIVSHSAQIGISIEPLVHLNQLTPAIENSGDNNFKAYASRTAENLYNFVLSFGITIQPAIGQPASQVVPISAISQWYQNYTRKLDLNPNFWKS